MKRVLFFLAGSLMAASGSAKDCYESLTAELSKDSQAFQLSEVEVGNSDSVGLEYATAAVSSLAKKLKCDRPIVVDRTQSACREIVPGVLSSEACYIKTDLGYFITNVDYLANINLVFNRWD